MIEKVEIITNMQPQTELEKSILRVFNGVATILNEVIDAVNGVLTAQEQYATIYNENIVPMLTPKNEEPADPYAEQRKWIGKLCKFWFADAEHPTFGILDFVDAGPHPEPFHINCGESEQGWYPYCEPVKPTDSIIYKGGDND